MGIMNKNLIRQAQQMQAQLAKAQEELESATVEGSSGGGVVKVVASGKQLIQSITLDPSVVDPTDIDLLQDLVLAAINDALVRSQQVAQERLGAITGNLKIPGM